MAQAAAPLLDLYEDAAVKGIFRWCLAILIAPDYGFGRTVKPRSREAVRRRRRACGCAQIRNIIVAMANICLLSRSCVCLSYGFGPIQGEPFAWRAALAAPTYIRPDVIRSKVPHARCEGAGSKGDGTILYRGVFQPCRDPVTHPPWIS